MLLKTLKPYKPNENAHFLAKLILSLSPNPGISPLPNISDEELELRKKVIEEICRQRKIKDRSSPDGKFKIFDVLSFAISEAALHGKNIEQLNRKIGQRGLLKPSLYKIKFTQIFKNTFVPLGSHEGHARGALENPDAYEHLFSDEEKLDKNTPSYSIYLKKVDKVRDSFTLIVMTARKGDEQYVGPVWRLYHSEFKENSYHYPTEALRAFALKYGVEFKIGSEKNKFFLKETITLKKSHPTKEDIQKKVLGEFYKKENYVSCFFEKSLNKESLITIPGKELLFDVHYAFVIDLNKYRHDLIKHGVNIKD